MIINDFNESVQISYPNYLISNSSCLKNHQAMVLKKMMEPIKGQRADYKVYIKDNGEIFEIGGIFRGSVRSLITLIGKENLILNLGKGKTYTGDMLYVLG